MIDSGRSRPEWTGRAGPFTPAARRVARIHRRGYGIAAGWRATAAHSSTARPVRGHEPSKSNVVPRQQVALGVTRDLGPSLESIYSRIRANFLRRRLFHASVLFLTLSGLGIYLGARTRPATVPASAVHGLNSASSAAVPGAEPLSERRATGPSDGLPSHAMPQTGDGNSIRSFKYVVQPNDTLRDLCVSMLGRYDSAVLSEIRQLNPDLKNSDHLDVGQEIRLPMSAAD